MEKRYEVEWISKVREISADRDFNPDTDLEYSFGYRKRLTYAKLLGEMKAMESRQDWAAITEETRENEYSRWERGQRLCWDGANWLSA